MNVVILNSFCECGIDFFGKNNVSDINIFSQYLILTLRSTLK